MLKEFKEFAFKGNVIDMAVGVIIGGAFGKIVTSLVNDIIMPVVGKLTAGVDVKNLKYVFSTAADGTESAILYGQFLQNILDFFIVAFCIFLAVRLITKRRKKKEEPAAPKSPTQEELLTEIRDLLKENAELKQNSIK